MTKITKTVFATSFDSTVEINENLEYQNAQDFVITPANHKQGNSIFVSNMDNRDVRATINGLLEMHCGWWNVPCCRPNWL